MGISDKKNFLKYNDLVELVKLNKISTKEEYIHKYAEIHNDSGLKAPSNPNSFYKNEWTNWSKFLSKPLNKKKHNNVYYSYSECKNKIQSKKIKSKNDFYIKINEIIKSDIRIPYSPNTIYKNEWEGWGEFIGTKSVQPQKKEFLSYDECKNWAKQYEFRFQKEWRKLNKKLIPENIPHTPDQIYKNNGWVSWNEFFGIDNQTNISYGEKKIWDYLDSKKIKFIYNKSLNDCKNKHKLRFDFYLPENKTCIEYDGIQHYKPIDLFGGEIEFNKTKKRDNIKNLFCEINEIELLRIPYYLNDNEIYKLLDNKIKIN